ncbi:TPA: acyltransferase family protein, partial [Escherichia coli]
IFGIKTNDHGPTNFGMFYMISFFILILYSDWIEKNTKFPKWLIFSGNISFSIYLTHIIVIHLISILYQPLNFDALTKAILIIISSIPVIFFISYLSYVILEKKLHDLFMNNVKKKAVA